MMNSWQTRGLRGLVLLLLLLLAPAARAIEWTVDPAYIPWETLSTVPDAHRQPARSYPEVARRMDAVQESLRDGRLSREDRAALLVEMGDLFRDEARLVIEAEFLDEPRILLPTSPAWLQLELALRWYEEARREDAESIDVEGRITLITAVTRARLLMDAETFSSYAKVIRSYRSSPYADVAKLAVGDHHFRAGDIRRARAAFRLVRDHRLPELAAYAEYRLAHCEAVEGRVDRAIGRLDPLVRRQVSTPLLQMVRDASRFATANLLAPRLELPRMVAWSSEACVGQLDRCSEEVREAAADGYRSDGQLAEAAWLEAVDPLLEALVDSEKRSELAALTHPDTDSVELLRTLLDACPERSEISIEDVLLAGPEASLRHADSCRADISHAAAEFYELAERPEGMWLRGFEKLPKFPGRADLDWILGEIAREALPARQALTRLVDACEGDPACADLARLHLLQHFESGWRAPDARWLRWLSRPPRLPAVPEEVVADIVEEHVDARTALERVRPHCGSRCGSAILDPLAGYFHDIGAEGDARWLRSVGAVPPTGRAGVDELVWQVAREELGALAALRRVPSACPRDPGCAVDALAALRDYYRAATRPRELSWLAPLEELDQDAELLLGVLRVAEAEAEPEAAVALLEQTCATGDLPCSRQRRTALVTWYRQLGRPLAAARVAEVPSVPGRADVTRALQRALQTSSEPSRVLARVLAACMPADEACQREAVAALAEAYEARGRAVDANEVRTGGGLPISP